jgi:hypothetical protein
MELFSTVEYLPQTVYSALRKLKEGYKEHGREKKKVD